TRRRRRGSAWAGWGLVALVLCAGLVSALGESIIRSRRFGLFFWEALLIPFLAGAVLLPRDGRVMFHGGFLFLEDGFLR
ncbi:hypothetical protein K438DRAFT_1848738, partial [Mycena galopus ATCC 62051]